MIKKILLIAILFTVLLNCHSPVQVTVTSSNSNNNSTPSLPSNIQAPSTGLWGEYIQITGEDLDSDILTFKFDDATASFYQYAEDTVFVKVPREIERYNPTFSIYEIGNDSLIHASNFRLNTPSISHAENTNVEFGDRVWFYGENLDLNSNFLTAKLNDIEVPIYRESHDSIQITIPNNIDSRVISLKLNAQLQDIEFNDIIQLKRPEITASSLTTTAGGVITLKGTNFNPDPSLGTFKINDELDTYAYYVHNTDSLILEIPFGPFEDFMINKITYVTAGMQTDYTTPIPITSDYILYTKNNPTNFSSSIYNYNDKSYAFGRNDDYNANGIPIYFLYELNHNTRVWTRIESVSFATYSFNEAITDTGEFFVFTKKLSDTENTIYNVNLNSLTMTTISSPPNNSQARHAPTIFWYNDYLYFGKGRQGSEYYALYHTDLYRYNTNTQIWSTLTSDNSEFYARSNYNYLGYKYILAYKPDYTGQGLYQFDIQNNSFTLITPTDVFEATNVFNYQNSLLRATTISSIDELRFYNHDNQIILERLDIQRIQSPTKFFSIDDKVLFSSKVTNHRHAPSNGIYLVNPNISNQL